MSLSKKNRSRRKVSFADTPIHIPNNAFFKDELRTQWYSREELMASCDEARKIVNLIHQANGKLETIDHNQHCVVGLEKYHLKKEREKYRKLLTKTILLRQQMNRGLGLGPNDDDGCLSQISEMMSTSFKDFALWQAAMHEFHAYGSTKPCPSLISKSIANANCKPSSREMQGNKRARQFMLESSFDAGISLANNPLVTNNVPSKATTTATTTTTTVDSSAASVTHAQNPRLVHHDMMAVMEGYVERKRLRSEVRSLIHPSFGMATHCPFPPLVPTTTTTTITSTTTTETPMPEERR